MVCHRTDRREMMCRLMAGGISSEVRYGPCLPAAFFVG